MPLQRLFGVAPGLRVSVGHGGGFRRDYEAKRLVAAPVHIRAGSLACTVEIAGAPAGFGQIQVRRRVQLIASGKSLEFRSGNGQ